jgi:hypothetical protein
MYYQEVLLYRITNDLFSSEVTQKKQLLNTYFF